MWVRKSEAAIQQSIETLNRRRKKLWPSLAMATTLTAVIVILYSLGIRSTAPAKFGLRTVIMALILFLFFFALSIYTQKRDGGLFANSSLLCKECKEPCRSNQELRCHCGGNLEPFDYFHWIPEEIDTDANETELKASAKE
jgi:hypothetical protein